MVLTYPYGQKNVLKIIYECVAKYKKVANLNVHLKKVDFIIDKRMLLKNGTLFSFILVLSISSTNVDKLLTPEDENFAYS